MNKLFAELSVYYGRAYATAPAPLAAAVSGAAGDAAVSLGFIYRHISCESCSLFDSTPLSSLNNKQGAAGDASPAVVAPAVEPTVEPTVEPMVNERIRGTMWALGHIGACDTGYGLLQMSAAMLTPSAGASAASAAGASSSAPGERGSGSGSGSGAAPAEELSVLHMLTELAMSAPNFSVRGTAFCVVGLFSQSSVARSELDALGWGVSTHGLSSSACPIAVPHTISRLFESRPPLHSATAAAAAAAFRGGSASASGSKTMAPPPPCITPRNGSAEEAVFGCVVFCCLCA